MINRRILIRYCSECLEQFPSLYVKTMHWRLRGKPPQKKVITADSLIVIEGFPRCANSFAVKAFRNSNDPEREHRIATHLHSPAHVLMGLKFKIPTLVVTRTPDQAIPSLLALSAQLGKAVSTTINDRDKQAYVAYWTRYYTRFYQRLMPYKSQFVIGEFKQVTSDFNVIITRLNAHFKTHFKPFDHSPEAVKEIFDSAKVHLSPSAERDALKERFRELYFGLENAHRREAAKATYAAFIAEEDLCAHRASVASGSPANNG